MSKHSWRLSTPEKVAKIIEGFDSAQGIAHEDAEILIGGIERLQGQLTTKEAELSRLQTRLAECEKKRVADKEQHAAIFEAYDVERGQLQRALEKAENGRDELAKKRKDDSFECSVMSAITGRENGETLTMAVDRTCRELDKANQDLSALRALVVKPQEALKELLAAMRRYELDCGVDPPHDHLAMMRRAEQALALTPASLHGMAVVPEASHNDPPVSGPRYEYQLTERQLARMESDWTASQNLESMAGRANAFRIGWTMAASRAPSSDKWNDLVGKLDAAQQELAELRRDRERLDWLTGLPIGALNRILIGKNLGWYVNRGEGPTPRAAIDAARSAGEAP